MKKVIVVAISMIMLCAIVSCKPKTEKDKLPDVGMQKQITAFAPLPSFKEVFRTIDQFETKDIDAATKEPIYSTKQEVPRNAFTLGLLTADAIIASRTRNKKRLLEVSKEMMKLTTLIGLEDQFNSLGDDIRIMIEKEQWEDLDKALDTLKKDVEDKLWESEEFDNYTMMLLGGWNQALNRMAFIMNKNYNVDKSKVLNQKGTWNSLIANLEAIDKEYLIGQAYFVQSIVIAKEIKAVLDADTDGTFSKEQIALLIQKTEAIKAALKK